MRQYVERLARLEDERREIVRQIEGLAAEAEASGIDPAELSVAVADELARLARSTFHVVGKLEAVESRIVTFEEEFLPHILLPNGSTVYEATREQVRIAYETGEMPKLLPSAAA